MKKMKTPCAAIFLGLTCIVPSLAFPKAAAIDDQPSKAPAAATSIAPTNTNAPLSAATNYLKSRMVFARTVFKQGEPIIAKVLVRNFSRQPVHYDRRGIDDAHYVWSRFNVTGPNGRRAPDLSTWAQWMMRTDKSTYPIIEPGQEIEVDQARLDAPDYYMGLPGKYLVTWQGTFVLPANGFASDNWNRDVREARRFALGLPPVGPVEIEVVPAPGGGPDGDVVGRILAILPPGWRIDGAKILADAVKPTGRKSGKGSLLHLHYNPAAGYTAGEHAALDLSILKEPAAEVPNLRTNEAAVAQYLGNGPLGHVYLGMGSLAQSSDIAFARWTHAIYDIAAALAVRDPAPARPAGPDWGRVVCQLLSESAAEYQSSKLDSLFYLCARSRITTGANGQPLVYYDSKAVSRDRAARTAGAPPVVPDCLVSLSVLPIGQRAQQNSLNANKSIQWDGTSALRSYRVARVDVDIVIEVRSEDQEFVRRLNAILDRAITALLQGVEARAAI